MFAAKKYRQTMVLRSSIFASSGNSSKARILVAAVFLAVLGLLSPTLKTAGLLSYQDTRYIQIITAPLICLFLIYSDRKRVFATARYSPRPGLPLFFLSVLFCLICIRLGGTATIESLIAPMLSLFLLCQSVFVLYYGLTSWRAALYPLGCLLLVIPIPEAAMNWASTAYQQGSALASYAIFNMVGISALRNGNTFSIPGLDFNIAPECSGIRSGVAFLLVALVAGHMYLHSGWNRLFLTLATLPIAMVKNAIRIVVTTSLGAYVDRSYIDGPFHHQYGGIIFSPLDFLFFVPLVLWLQRIERRAANLKASSGQAFPLAVETHAERDSPTEFDSRLGFS